MSGVTEATSGVDETTGGTAPGHDSRARPRAGRRRGRRGWFAGGAAAVVLVAAGGLVAVDVRGGRGGAPVSSLPPATATVERESLKDTTSESGELGYGSESKASSQVPGVLTRVAASGRRLDRGDALFWVDEKPTVLMYGATPAYRAMTSGDEGADVHQLERNLAALGYTGFTVDDEFTAGTAAAVKEWQADLGLDATGVVELGRVAFVRGAVRVASVAAAKGTSVQPGAEVLAYTGTTQVVTVSLDPSDQRLVKKGARVSITLPDATVVPGVITSFASEVVTASTPDGTDSTQVVVTVRPSGEKAQKAADGYSLATADVAFTAGTRKDVLTVPVAALLALSEGGFGVERIDGGRSTYVPVETGLFADGRVEISGEGIAEGDTVGVPA